MSRPDEGTETAVPAAWRAAHLMHQALILVSAGALFAALTWTSPMYKALLAGLPAFTVPPGIDLSPRLFGPLLAPIVLGVPLVFGRQRALTMAWVVVMTVLSAIAVIEVSFLNWISFLSGVAFRIESGPVPLVRTVLGAAVVLAGLLLVGQQATLETVRHLAERGVPLARLREVRGHLLTLERALVGALLGAAVVLTLVAAVSMGATDSAPESGGSWVPPLVWVALLVALLLVAFALGLWRRRGRSGEEVATP